MAVIRSDLQSSTTTLCTVPLTHTKTVSIAVLTNFAAQTLLHLFLILENFTVYGRYEQNAGDSLYLIPTGEANPFSKQIRLKLIYYILRAPHNQGGCGLEVKTPFFAALPCAVCFVEVTLIWFTSGVLILFRFQE